MTNLTDTYPEADLRNKAHRDALTLGYLLDPANYHKTEGRLWLPFTHYNPISGQNQKDAFIDLPNYTTNPVTGKRTWRQITWSGLKSRHDNDPRKDLATFGILPRRTGYWAKSYVILTGDAESSIKALLLATNGS